MSLLACPGSRLIRVTFEGVRVEVERIAETISLEQRITVGAPLVVSVRVAVWHSSSLVAACSHWTGAAWMPRVGPPPMLTIPLMGTVLFAAPAGTV